MAAPGGTPAIGPWPERVGDDEAARDEYDRLRRRVLWTLPYGLYIIGSRSGDEFNAMTANWVTQVAFEPKLVGVGVETSALTHRLIAEGGSFTVCTISREDRAVVRKFTKPVETDLSLRTVNGFGFHTATTGAPILDLAVAWLDCRLTQTVACGGHSFFIGEVVDTDFRADEDTPVLRMEDTRMNYGG